MKYPNTKWSGPNIEGVDYNFQVHLVFRWAREVRMIMLIQSQKTKKTRGQSHPGGREGKVEYLDFGFFPDAIVSLQSK